MNPHFAEIGIDVDAPRFVYQDLWEQGYGDAFAHFLLDRDISKFDPHNLPEDLLAMYDEDRKGFEIPHSIAAALDEIATTFGHWCDPKNVPENLEDVTPNHWPLFVAGQQVFATRSSYEGMAEGEDIHAGKKKNGHTERLMRNAGYIRLAGPSGKLQWVGSLPTKEAAAKGVQRVQSAVYYRTAALPNGTTMSEKHDLCKKFITKLTEYWRTEDGLRNYFTRERF